MCKNVLSGAADRLAKKDSIYGAHLIKNEQYFKCYTRRIDSDPSKREAFKP